MTVGKETEVSVVGFVEVLRETEFGGSGGGNSLETLI